MNLDGKKVLITGATGMVGKPIAESLAAGSQVYAAARFKDPDAKAALESAGVTCVSADLMSGDLSGLPDIPARAAFLALCDYVVERSG